MFHTKCCEYAHGRWSTIVLSAVSYIILIIYIELFQKNDIVKEDEFHILYGTEWNNEKG